MKDAGSGAADNDKVGTRGTDATQGSKRALLYLRVSTKEQAMRSGDPEGYSLPTQREACLRKALSLGAEVVDEYLDKDTGTMVDKRPEMQRLLARIEERDIDYVIVHKLDRLARNRLDDAHMTVTLEAAGATLVSCVEGIDQSPSGRLLHGMLASVNEYYSRNLSDEIKRKTLQKAKNGGTPFRAPIGYVNRQDLSGGRDDRWVEIDPVRGPLVTWAFEAYATGEWSLSSLRDELTARGLMTRPTAKNPSKELDESVLQQMLVRRYYTGIVEFRGVEYQGSHPPLVTPEVFNRVREVLTAHNTAGERHWKHSHYLKGSVYCDSCEERFSMQFTTGNGGRYCYFFCLGRRRGLACRQASLQADAMEAALLRHWRTVRIPEARRTEVRRLLAEDLEVERAEAETDRRLQERRIRRLKDERQKLLDGYYAGAIPLDLMKTEQERIGTALAGATARLDRLTTRFDGIETVILRAMDWVDSLHEAYQAADDHVRRLLNQALYEQVFVNEDGVVRVVYSEGFAWLLGVEEEQSEESNRESSEAEGGDNVIGLVSDRERTDERPGQRTRAYHRNSLVDGLNVRCLVRCSPKGLTCGNSTATGR